MNSLDTDCLELKKKYDDCFNVWFSEKFLKGDSRDTCAPLFQVYHQCVKVNRKYRKVDVALAYTFYF